MKTRIGKIARLPKEIREQLNQQLEDGVPCKHLVVWLNGLPEVQRVMAAQFGGRPILKQNLSDWLHGGYQDWRYSRDNRIQLREMMAEAESLHQKSVDKTGNGTGHYLGMFVLVELAEVLDRVHDMKPGNERWKLLRRVSAELSRLRTDECREQRLRLRQLTADETEANTGESR